MTAEKEQKTKNKVKVPPQQEKKEEEIHKDVPADGYLEELQRVQAEFANYRKRIIREKEEFRKYMLEGILYDLLSVLDNIQRALKTKDINKSGSDTLFEGIKVVEKQFLELLKSKGVAPLKADTGDRFDPHLHHAVTHEPSEKYPADAILSVLQAGYVLRGRVLRPAVVVVSKGSGGAAGQKDKK